MTNDATEAEDTDSSKDDAKRSTLRWVAQYLFWVIVLFSVATAAWWSASDGSAFRYAGF